MNSPRAIQTAWRSIGDFPTIDRSSRCEPQGTKKSMSRSKSQFMIDYSSAERKKISALITYLDWGAQQSSKNTPAKMKNDRFKTHISRAPDFRGINSPEAQLLSPAEPDLSRTTRSERLFENRGPRLCLSVFHYHRLESRSLRVVSFPFRLG